MYIYYACSIIYDISCCTDANSHIAYMMNIYTYTLVLQHTRQLALFPRKFYSYFSPLGTPYLLLHSYLYIIVIRPLSFPANTLSAPWCLVPCPPAHTHTHTHLLSTTTNNPHSSKSIAPLVHFLNRCRHAPTLVRCGSLPPLSPTTKLSPPSPPWLSHTPPHPI